MGEWGSMQCLHVNSGRFWWVQDKGNNTKGVTFEVGCQWKAKCEQRELLSSYQKAVVIRRPFLTFFFFNFFFLPEIKENNDIFLGHPRMILVLEALFHLSLTCCGSINCLFNILICGLHAMPLCFFLFSHPKSFFFFFFLTVVVLVNNEIILFKSF